MSQNSTNMEYTKTVYSLNNIDPTKVRILQKNVVYVIGLSFVLANENILRRKEFFGQYGQIIKIVVNTNGYTQSNGNEITYSSYITYKRKEEASLALLAIDNCVLDGNLIRCSFGTTKYCSFFLKGIPCFNRNCLYLHEWAEESDIILKEGLSENKQIFTHQQSIAKKILGFSYPKDQNYICNSINILKCDSNGYYSFPSPETVYQKERKYTKLSLSNSGVFIPTKYKKSYSRKNSYASYRGKSSSDLGYMLSPSMNYLYKEGYEYEYEVKDYDPNENEEEESNEEELHDEYVLVKETKKRKKWFEKKEYYSENIPYKKLRPKFLSFNEDRMNRNTSNKSNSKKIPLENNFNYSTETNGSSIKDTSSSELNKCLDFISDSEFKPFKSANASRFDFVNEDIGMEDKINVPNYIQDILSSKLYFLLYTHSLNDSNFYDDLIYENEQKEIWNWENLSKEKEN
ncbi:MAG: hypothetical protein MJ252_01645 [archaeon]|nr:hypothetical protein [archaeon]